MLKRKQKRAGFVGYSFLLLTTPAITAITQDPFNYTIATSHYKDPVKRGFFADTSTIKTTAKDSSGELNETEKILLKAPVVKLNSNATKFVREYVKKNALFLTKVKERSDPYFTVMDSVFSLYDLPLQLKYLAVIESELKLKATSHVGAAGLWQLMPGTAKMLGLKVSKKYDERRLCYKSTRAAAKYLNTLYGQFGDWLLVIAAYNSGPGYVYSAIKKSGSRNFWHLQRFLPAETRMHVKRFIGTHYFFEGEGSITTLTKAEAAGYLKAVAAFMEQTTPPKTTEIVSPQENNIVIALAQ